MNGVHDLGGMHGFGEVEREPGPPPLERWEAAMIALDSAMEWAQVRNLDEFRFAIERMDPQDYLNSTYFEHWLHEGLRTVVEKGIVSAEEIKRRAALFAADPGAPLEAAFNGQATFLPPTTPAPGTFRREVATPARFAAGDAVRTRNFAPKGHTRLPRYARGKRGVVSEYHDAMVFPDSNAMGRGEDPQHLYSVRFEASELWGEDAGSREAVYLDLWEPYLVSSEQ